MPSTAVQCPNCGSFATRPTHGDDQLNRERNAWARIASDLSFGRKPFTFDNPQWVQKFKDLQVAAVCDTCKFIFKANIEIPEASANTGASDPKRNLAERLALLEQLRAKGLVTDEEYDRKREDILRSL